MIPFRTKKYMSKMIFLAEPPIDFESQIKRPTGFPPPLLLVIEFFML
jgi:hypothetical protein